MSPGRTASVLLVDDQPENLLALEAVLKPLGLHTVRATSGEEALRQLLLDDFAAILLDVQMPGMDGFETAELIKQRERTQHIPIIFLTAIDKERQQVFRGYSVGAVDYLFKPFDPDVLRSKVGVFVDLYEKNVALAESEERFRTAFANAPIGIGLMDADGSFLDVNRALCSLLGQPPMDLIGKKPWELTHSKERSDEHKGFQQMVKGESTGHQAERRLRHKDGHFVYGLVSLSLAHDADGNPRGGIWQVADITERRRAEMERAERMREQAARAEAEAVTDTIQKIQRITDAALEHLAMDDLLSELTVHLADILDVDLAAILLLDENEEALTVGAASGIHIPVDEPIPVPIDGTLAGRIVTGRQPARLQPGESSALAPLLEGRQMSALLGVPLIVEGRVNGVIEVGSLTERDFTREVESLLQLIADRAALAIEHARLYQREVGIVETLQRSLLPDRLPEVPGLLTAAKYMPGGPGADVGGDWYDAIALDGGRLGLAMGDVVGHGIGAAALMGQLRNALRAYALDGASPGEVVEKLDRMVQQLEAGRMATLLYMVIEPDLGSLTLASAGHLPPLELLPNGEARYLEGGRTLPLGVMPSIEYPEAHFDLEPGSTLVMYTDGLVEERGKSIDVGLEMLKEAVADGPDAPEALCDHIVNRLLANRAATDDIAVLTVRTVPMSAERLHLDLPTNPKSLATLRRTLGRWLESLGASRVESNDVQVACHEACSNAMEHAYRFREATIDVDGEFDGEEVRVTITDHGAWREKRDSDRGRGLDLIRALMDEVEVTPSDSGTSVRIRKRLAEPAPAPAPTHAEAGEAEAATEPA
jgi:PAS domain S-box-containing protein